MLMLKAFSKIRSEFAPPLSVVVVVVVMSGAVFFYLFSTLENFILKQSIDPIQLQVQNHANLGLRTEDWENWRSPESVVRLKTYFLELNIDPKIIRINLFNTDNILIWSSFPTEIGMVVEKESVVRVIASGEKIIKSASPEGTTAKAFNIKNLLEIYVPISSKTGEVIGVAEVYFDHTEHAALRRNIRVLILGSTLATIIIINLLFFSTLKKTKKIQKAYLDLATEKRKLETTLESIGDGAFVIDVDGRLTFFNKIAEELTGERKEDVLGKSYRTVLKFVREKDRSPNYTFIENALTKNTITHIQNHTILVSKDGGEIPVADSAAPIHDASGNVIGCIVVFRDVTREYAIDKAKTEFISLASHQLRTPLSAIKWSLETELDGSLGKLSGEQEEFIQNAYSAAQRMTILVNSLLNISRIETERLAVKPEPTDLALFCKQILTELQPIITQKEHEMQFLKPDTFPVVTTDPKLLHEVVTNLLSNAIKYTPNRGTIVLGLELRGPNVVVTVKDNGLGIPKAQQQRIYEKFFRADNVVGVDTEGTGLGLYIVKRLVEVLEGNIWFESEEKKGTTFFVAIPLKGIGGRAGEKSLS